MSHVGPKDEIEPRNSLQRHRSNISLGEISVDDLQFITEEQAAGNPAKEYTKAPKDRDLLNRFQVFCIIANRMMGTSSLHHLSGICKSFSFTDNL
jgi:hypothetical protein